MVISPVARGLRHASAAVFLAVIAAGCSERERPTGPSGGGGPSGAPLVAIFTPGSDTTITAGDPILVSGVISDDAGVDSLYIDIVGGEFEFPPTHLTGVQAPFSFTIPTVGLSGRELQIVLTAVDVDGNTSTPTRRILSVQ